MEGDYTPRQVAELRDQRPIQLIDVRQRHEHEAGRIAGSRLIELADLAAQAQTLDPRETIVFYCRSGARSGMATQLFREAGYDAHNMAGGLLEWQATGLPLDPAEGYVAEA